MEFCGDDRGVDAYLGPGKVTKLWLVGDVGLDKKDEGDVDDG